MPSRQWPLWLGWANCQGLGAVKKDLDQLGLELNDKLDKLDDKLDKLDDKLDVIGSKVDKICGKLGIA